MKIGKFDETSEHHDICHRLKFLREKHFGQRSKRKFAGELGLPLSTYASYEAGRVAPPDVLVKVSEVTQCDLHWLMTGKFSDRSANSVDPEISDMLGRMERLICDKPQAKEAVAALLNVLSNPKSEASANLPTADLSAVAPDDDINHGHVIPILGRAAAGVAAIWESSDEDYADLSAMIQWYYRSNICNRFKADLVDPLFQRGEGRAEVLQLAQPIGDMGSPVDGVILSDNFTGRGKMFAVSLTGQSMEPRLQEGDYVIADSGSPAQSGNICLVELHDRIGAMCKIYYPEDRNVRLGSLNTSFDPIVVDREQVKWAFKVIAAIRS